MSADLFGALGLCATEKILRATAFTCEYSERHILCVL